MIFLVITERSTDHGGNRAHVYKQKKVKSVKSVKSWTDIQLLLIGAQC